MIQLPIGGKLLADLIGIKEHVYAAIDIAAAKALFEIRSMVVRDRRSLGQKVRWMNRADKRI